MFKTQKDVIGSNFDVNELNLQNIRNYIRWRKWQLDASTSNKDRNVYHREDSDDLEIILPLTRDFADYNIRIINVLEILSEYEKRPVSLILNEIVSPPADIIRFRVSAPNISLDSIPLEAGVNYIQGTKDILLAAALSTNNPQAYYQGGRTPSDVAEYISSCRLGQSERGSYVTTILSPVPPYLETQDNFLEEETISIQDEPFTRRVTITLMTALNIIKDSIESGNNSNIINNIKSGVSSNLCQAIADMQPIEDQTSLDVSINWSYNRPFIPKKIPCKVTFSNETFPIIKEAARKLVDIYQPKIKNIIGTIVNLHAETSIFDIYSGDVTVKANINGRVQLIKMKLNKGDYEKACNAHRDSKQIFVRGILNREKKNFYIQEPTAFTVISY